MAYSESATIVSAAAGSTFTAADLYKPVVVNSSGKVILSSDSSTGGYRAYGSLYGRTATTSAGEAVPVAIGGIVKCRLAASTLSAGDFIAASTGGFWAAAAAASTADTGTLAQGQIVSGSSGGIRVVSAKLFA